MDKIKQEQIKNMENAIQKEQAFIDECDEALNIFDHTAPCSIAALRAYISSVQANRSDRMNFYLDSWDRNLATIQYLLNNMYREVSVVRNTAESSVEARIDTLLDLRRSEEEDPAEE